MAVSEFPDNSGLHFLQFRAVSRRDNCENGHRTIRSTGTLVRATSNGNQINIKSLGSSRHLPRRVEELKRTGAFECARGAQDTMIVTRRADDLQGDRQAVR